MELGIGLIVGFVLLIMIGVYLLSRGPISLSTLTPTLEESLNPEGSPFKVTVGDTRLVWGGWDRAIDVVAADVRVTKGRAPPLAVLPEVSVGLSFKALLRGEARLAAVEVLHPTIALLRFRDGRLSVAIDEFDDDETISAQDQTDSTWLELPKADQPGVIPPAILDYLIGRQEIQGVFSDVTRFSVIDADIRIFDFSVGESLNLTDAGFFANRSEHGLNGTFTGRLETAGRETTVGATLNVDNSEERISASVGIGELDTELLARYIPALSDFLPNLSISGSADGTFDFSGEPLKADAELRSAAGSVSVTALPGTAFPEMSLEADIDGLDIAQWLGGLKGAEAILDYAPRTALSGTTSVRIDSDGQIASLAAALHADDTGTITLKTVPQANGDTKLRLVVSELRPGKVAQTSPALGDLESVTVPLSGTASVTLSPDWQPTAADMAFNLGAGTLALGDRMLPDLTGGRIDAAYSAAASTIDVKGLSLDFDGTVVSATGMASFSDDDAVVAIDASVTDLPMNRLSEFWLPGLAPNPREWVLENIPEADVHEATITIRAGLPDFDPDAMILDELSGTIRFDNAEVHYLRPMAPATGVSGLATFGPSDFNIDILAGGLDDASVDGGRIEISNIGGDVERIAISVDVDTPLLTALELLDTEPRRYVSKIGLDPKGVSGRAKATVRFDFPLLLDLTGDLIHYESDAVLTNVSAPRDDLKGVVTSKRLNLTLRTGSLKLDGPIEIDGVPVRTTWLEDFSDGADTVRRFDIQTRAAVKELKRFDLDITEFADGPADVDLVYTVAANGAQRFDLKSDLTDADLAVDLIGFAKPAGTASKLTMQVDITPKGDLRFSNVVLDGGPDHLVKGNVSGTAGFDTVTTAVIDVARFGLTDLSGSVQRQAQTGTYKIDLWGKRLNAAPFLHDDGDAESPPETQEEEITDPKLRIRAQFDEIVDGPDRRVLSPSLAVDMDGTTLLLFRMRGDLSDDRHVNIDYHPTSTGGRELSVRADDTGLALAAADVTGRLEGGVLEITGSSPSPDAPLTGTVSLRDFTVREAPRLTKILQVISVTGILNAMTSDGLSFSSLKADFSLDDDLLEIKDAAARGSSMGITARGNINRKTDIIDLTGDVAISDIFSKTIGQLPGIDLLFGDGLIGATYTLKGDVDDPTVSVNPLSIIAPGFLRKVFEAPLDGEAGTAPLPPKRENAN